MSRKLYIINILLIVSSVFVLASSLFIEILHGNDFLNMPNLFWVALHAITGLVMGILVLVHLRLNWNTITNWITRFKKSPNKVTKTLFVLSILMFVSGILATFTFFTNGHGPIGGIHGKISLIFLFICIGHFIKRIKWYKRK